MRPLILLLFILSSALIISCNSNRNRSENKQKLEQTFLLHGPIQESTAPKNLTAYFDSLQQQGFFIPYHTDSTEQQKVIHTVALLQKYQIGERKYYPAEEVQAALELMRHELGYRQTIEVKSWQPKKQSSSFVFSNKQPAYVRMYIY